MTEIIKVVVNGNEKNIEVKDGLVLVYCGHGLYDGAFWKKLEECSMAELAAVEAVEETAQTNNLPTAAEAASSEDDTEEDYHSNFNKAVEFLKNCSAEDFVILVRYAKTHKNTFWHCVKELADVVNADDCYCSAIISLTRHFGKELEELAFQKLNLLEDGRDEEFIEFFNALKVINS